MDTYPKRRIPALILIALLTACAPTASTQPAAPDINQLNTAIVLTGDAARIQTQLASSPTPTSTITPTATITSSPTASSLPPTLTIPTDFATATPLVAQISVSTTTNCRAGPGKIYAYLSELAEGKVSEVLAVDPTGKYWYIPNPDSPGNFCWVWGEYATLSGNVAALPVYTPPPSPVPTFTLVGGSTSGGSGGSGGSGDDDDEPKIGGNGDMGPGYGPRPTITISYMTLDSCAGKWWVNFYFSNKSRTFNVRSIEISLVDSDTHVSASEKANGFRSVEGCVYDTTVDILHAEVSAPVSSPALDYDPTGHELELTVRACSAKDQGAPCSVKEKIEFVP
jgi:hypothetical protein